MVTFNYNSGDDNALSRVSALSFNGGTVAAWSYFGLSSVAETEYDDGTINSTLASGSSYPGLDLFGRVINLPWTKSTTGDLAQLKYGYDQASNRTYRQDVKAGTNFDELYSYDAMHRLQSAARGTLTSGVPPLTNPTLQQGWHLDATGNWVEFNNFDLVTASNSLMQQRASNAANELTAITATVGPAWQTPAYDRNGNMTTIPEPLDLTSGYTGVWDAYNRLIYLQSGDEKVEMCLYDGLNRRIMRNTYSPPGTLTESRFFVYSDQWQVLEEYVAATSLTVPVVQWVWGIRYIDDCVLRDTLSGGTLTLRLYALQDANWNVVAVYNPASGGSIVERYAYTPYGVVQFLNSSFGAISASAYSWETLYCGYRYDAAVGLYLIRNRWLIPPFGCWLSRDPATGSRHDGHLLEYASGNPVSRTDPSGLQPLTDSQMESFLSPARSAVVPPELRPHVGGPGRDCAACHPVQPWRWPPAQNSKVKVCGPDVTDELKGILIRVRQAYANWSYPEQVVACLPLRSMFGWDIGMLHYSKWTASYSPACASPYKDCHDTVQVDGKCYNAGTVNYVLLGVMADICWFGKTDIVAAITVWKLAPQNLPQFTFENLEESIAWAFAGYAGWPSPNAPSPPANRPACSPTCKKKYSSGRFSASWPPKLIP